jgi:hypothetical protein
MTIRLLFEEESGSSTGRRHPHNGYYAGDFSGRTPATQAPTSPVVRMRARRSPAPGRTRPPNLSLLIDFERDDSCRVTR